MVWQRPSSAEAKQLQEDTTLILLAADVIVELSNSRPKMTMQNALLKASYLHHSRLPLVPHPVGYITSLDFGQAMLIKRMMEAETWSNSTLRLLGQREA